MKYHCGVGVSWAVEQAGVRLRNSETGDVRYVSEPEAAVWDLVTRGYPVNKITEMMVWIAGLDPDASIVRVTEALTDWMAAGYLTCENDHG